MPDILFHILDEILQNSSPEAAATHYTKGGVVQSVKDDLIFVFCQ